MLRFQRGDIGAFAELLQRHKGPLFTFVLRQLQSRAAAEDALQEVLLRVIEKASEFRHEGHFTTWVYAIAHDSCVAREHQSPERQLFIQSELDEGDSKQTTIPEGEHLQRIAERCAFSSEPRSRTAERVEDLPEELREVFLLRELAHLPFKEIAKVTCSSETTVKNHMRLALERLQGLPNESDETVRLSR